MCIAGVASPVACERTDVVDDAMRHHGVGAFSCTSVHMKTYSVANVRKQLAKALDLAESGESVAIERRGVLFELKRRDAHAASGRGRKLVDILDDVIADGDWHWTAPGPKMTMKKGATRSPRKARRK
jgi:hypothetical protein